METGLGRHKSLFNMVMENIGYHWHSPSKMYAILFSFQKTTQQGTATTLVTALDPAVNPGTYVRPPVYQIVEDLSFYYIT